MDRVFLDFGVFKIYYYSLFIFLGVLMALVVVYLELRKEKVDRDKLVDVVFYTIIWAFIGARLYYVIFNLSYYLNNPLEIFYVWHGGLAIHGGILGGFLYLLFHSRKQKSNLLKFLDIVVVGLILGQALGRWGNFFNSEAYGSLTTLGELQALGIPQFIIEGMYINGNYYQPTFFYESICDFLGFITLVLVRYKKKNLRVGQLSGIYLMWYSVTRFFIEGLRMDSLMLGPIRVAQLVSIVLCIIGIYLIFIRKSKLYKEVKINE